MIYLPAIMSTEQILGCSTHWLSDYFLKKVCSCCHTVYIPRDTTHVTQSKKQVMLQTFQLICYCEGFLTRLNRSHIDLQSYLRIVINLNVDSYSYK